MSRRLQPLIKQILLCASALFAANCLAAAGVQNPPPGPGMVPDYFGVVPNYANSPQPVMAVVTIKDSGGGSGAKAAATTYDYFNSVRNSRIMDVEVADGGTAYTSATTVTVSGGPGSQTLSLTAKIVNGVIVGFAEIPSPLPNGWKGLGSGYTTPIVHSGIRKFVDSLPLINQANDLGQQLPVAVPDIVTFPGADYYEIAVSNYTQKLHTDLPPTLLRGYKQLNAPAGSASAANAYLGPVIVAQKNRPVRVKLVNQLPVGTAGNLPLPVDHTYMGAADSTDTDNRISLHMHGGNTPWISDGLPRQWIKPAGEAGANKGISAVNVPDMWFDATTHGMIRSCAAKTVCSVPNATNDPGDGALTFYFTNQQSQRLMFYHDHSEGTTRLNLYSGAAAGYILQDPTEQAMTYGGNANGISYPQILPNDTIPLIVQDKTFVPDNSTPVLNYYGAFTSQLNSQDPTWRWGSGAVASALNGNGDLWIPHVYMTNQNPGDISGANALGRWDYGPWFWPPFTGLINQPILNPYYDPACVSSSSTVCEPQHMPGVLNGNTHAGDPLGQPSGTPEALNDTPLVNGTVYPYMNVEPKKYRLRMLSIGNDRFLNLSMVVAASKNSLDTTPTGAVKPGNSIACNGVNAVNQADCTEVKMVPWNTAQNKAVSFPANWYTYQKGGITFDDRTGGVFDPQSRGPAMLQIGNEGGFLPAPTIIANQPINYEYNPKNIVIKNVKQHALLLGPAERAEVVVDFSQFAGSTIILFNDAPAPLPAYDIRYDLFTGDPDNTDTGGPFATLPGYGPNTRTIMQFRVAGSCSSANCGTGINLAPAVAAKTSQDFVDSNYFSKLTSAIQTAFKNSQETIIVPQNAYNAAYSQQVVDRLGSNVSRISDTQLSFQTFYANTPGQSTTLDDGRVTLGLDPKSIVEDFTQDYGKMNAMLGVEVPKTTATNQTTIQQAYIDPPTEVVKISPNDGSPVSGVMSDGTQLWKITHNGVDTHSIHFHLFNLQLINRVGWDGMVRMPEPNELGWKETIRMNPLEDVIVALRPKTMTLPFKVPNSHRLLDPSKAGEEYFFNLDPINGNSSNVTNLISNFGWESLWHCHILGHEESDMMRSIAVAQQPEDPSGLQQFLNANGSVTLSWTDNSIIANWVSIQRDTVATFNSANLTNFYYPINECSNQQGCQTNYIDTTVKANQGAAYFYRVQSNNTVGGGDYYSRLPKAVASKTPGYLGYDNVTASSNWSNTAAPMPIASIKPTALVFANQNFGTLSPPQTVTLSNAGNVNLAVSSVALTTNANFLLNNSCPGSLAPNASCTISVIFKPAAGGTLNNALTITDNSNLVANSRQIVSLTGAGILLPAHQRP